jgi:hypothetical protein
MPIKGLSYLKTTWAFQERPVASAKLNTWDDRIEGALELALYLLNQVWGGRDGVLRGATTGDLAVQPTAPASLAVTVLPGYAFIGRMPFKLAAETAAPPVAVPAAHPRIDLVQARLATWDVGLVTGTEAASPTTPDPDADCIALAELHLRPGMSHIAATDDGTNGVIVDARPFL